MIRGLLEWKHSALLTGLLITGVIEPLSADWSEHTRLLGGLIVFGVNLGLLLIVFDQRWERWLAFVLLPPILVSNIVHETLSNWAEVAVIVYHCFTLVFVGFAVAVILKHIFSQESIRTDAVIGALCGYLLAAVTWANAYALLYLLRPGSFRVADVIAGRLVDWHLRRFYFNYFSVTTLTSLGYADITPTDTVALLLSLARKVVRTVLHCGCGRSTRRAEVGAVDRTGPWELMVDLAVTATKINPIWLFRAWPPFSHKSMTSRSQRMTANPRNAFAIELFFLVTYLRFID